MEHAARSPSPELVRQLNAVVVTSRLLARWLGSERVAANLLLGADHGLLARKHVAHATYEEMLRVCAPKQTERLGRRRSSERRVVPVFLQQGRFGERNNRMEEEVSRFRPISATRSGPRARGRETQPRP